MGNQPFDPEAERHRQAANDQPVFELEELALNEPLPNLRILRIYADDPVVEMPIPAEEAFVPMRMDFDFAMRPSYTISIGNGTENIAVVKPAKPKMPPLPLFSNEMLDLFASARESQSHLSLLRHHYYQATSPKYLDLTPTDTGFVTAIPAKRAALEDRERFRVSLRPGKIFREVAGGQLAGISEHEWTKIATHYQSLTVAPELTFDVVEGDAIAEWYYEGNYHPSKYMLNQSCMRYEKCQQWFGLYTKNPDRVKMLTVFDESDASLLVARALIWNTDCGRTVLDRIYSDDATVEAVKQYAQEQGWHHRLYQSSDYNRRFVTPQGKEAQRTMTVTLEHPTHRWYPYLDTFSYMSQEYVLCNSEKRDAYWTLHSTRGDGGPPPADMANCAHCRNYFDLTDVVHVNGRVVCFDCLRGFYQPCMDCDWLTHERGASRTANYRLICNHCTPYHQQCNDCGYLCDERQDTVVDRYAAASRCATCTRRYLRYADDHTSDGMECPRCYEFTEGTMYKPRHNNYYYCETCYLEFPEGDPDDE
jgi:hypothetical protein